MTDYSVPKPTRQCAQSGRALADGEFFFSALIPSESGYQRVDIGEDAWNGPPQQALAWWRSQVPVRAAGRQTLAPNEVLWRFFSSLREQGHRPEMLYVLSLLLIRRRLLRLEETPDGSVDTTTLVVYAPRDDEVYHVPTVDLRPDQGEAIQQELDQLLGTAQPPGS